MNMGNIAISTHPFKNLSETPGIYAVYLNLNILRKPLDDKKVYPDKEINYSKIFDKVIRSHILPNPKDVDINIYGDTKNNILKISSRHQIKWEGDIEPKKDKEEIIKYLSCLTIFSKPIYVGKTIKNTIKKRLFQHRDKLSRISPSDEKAKKEIFSREDKLPHKLYRRGIEFKDLLIVCAPVDPDTPDEAISLGETLLQAIANPSLSVSN